MRTKESKEIGKDRSYNYKVADKVRRLSGIGLKKNTVESGGIYKIDREKIGRSGTATLLAEIYRYLSKEDGVKIEASRLEKAYKNLFSGSDLELDKRVNKAIEKLNRNREKPFNNYRGIRSGIINLIPKGFIKTFLIEA